MRTIKKEPIGVTKLFWITFLSAVIVFLILFGIFYYTTLQKEIPADSPLSGVTVPDFTAADSLNFLLIYDAALDASDLYAAVVCCNTATGIVSSCELDLRLQTMVNETRHTAIEQYKLRGVNGLCAAVENLLQAEFDAVIRTDQEGISETVEGLGGVILCTGDFQDLQTDGISSAYDFTKRFSDPENRGILLHRLIERIFSDTDSLALGKQLLFRHCETDFTAYMALDHQQAMRYLTEQQQFHRIDLTVHQTELNGQTVYYPDGDQLEELRRAMNG